MSARFALVALALAACGGAFPKATIEVGAKPIKAEIAATPELRARGLMNRESLPADRGMLFIYPDEAPRAFWMKNTQIPLDIAFADKDGGIVRIATMKPFDTSSTPSLYPAKYALEMNKGWFAANGVVVGDRISRIPEVEVR